MKDDSVLSDTLQQLQTEVTSTPSIVDDVMRRVEQKPMPRRRRRWMQNPAMAACAVAVVCLVGVSIAGWIVAGSRDSVNVAVKSGSQQTTERVEKNHELAQDEENLPKGMQELDLTGGSALTTWPYDLHNPRPVEDQISGETGDSGAGGQPFGRALTDSPRAGDMEIEYDRVGTQPKIVASTQPVTADGETLTGSPPDGRAGEQRPVQKDLVPMDVLEHRLGDGPLGDTNSEPGWERDSAKLADGLNDDTVGPSAESSLSKSEAIRLAAKCIRDAEPNLKLDAKSAVARYYHKAKAYNGNSLWLVGFPETGREIKKNADARSTQAVLYRMVWVQEDGSYSGNCLGELPPTKPPVWLGPDDEAKAIRLAKGFLRRHYPELAGHRPPTATFNTDNRAFGGGPMWIVGFERREDLRTGREVAGGPPAVQGVWVTLDGALMLGAVVRMGPTRAVPKDEAGAREPEAANPPPRSAEPAEKAGKRETAKGKEASWGPAADGLQCRLHVEKTTLKAGQWPRLLVDVKNGGDRELSLGEAPDFWELECDGTWYRAGVWFSGDIKFLELTPSNTHHGFPLLLGERWKWHTKGGNEPLAFGAGRHVLRVALQPAPKHGGKWPRLPSNPIEIEILPNQPTDD